MGWRLAHRLSVFFSASHLVSKTKEEEEVMMFCRKGRGRREARRGGGGRGGGREVKRKELRVS